MYFSIYLPDDFHMIFDAIYSFSVVNIDVVICKYYMYR